MCSRSRDHLIKISIRKRAFIVFRELVSLKVYSPKFGARLTLSNRLRPILQFENENNPKSVMHARTYILIYDARFRRSRNRSYDFVLAEFEFRSRSSEL